MPCTTARAIVAGAAALSITTPTVPAAAAPDPASIVASDVHILGTDTPQLPAVYLPGAADADARAALAAREARTRANQPASRKTARKADLKPRQDDRRLERVHIGRHRHTAHHHRTGRHRPSRARAARGLLTVFAFARRQIGDGYRHGADGPGAWDCSGLTAAAYAAIGIRLPHQSGAQASRGRPVSRAQARPGDLVVGPGHVGIYAGNGRVIDAGNPRVGVSERRMWPGLQIVRIV